MEREEKAAMTSRRLCVRACVANRASAAYIANRGGHLLTRAAMREGQLYVAGVRASSKLQRKSAAADSRGRGRRALCGRPIRSIIQASLVGVSEMRVGKQLRQTRARVRSERFLLVARP